MLGLALLAVFVTLSLLTDATGIVGRWIGAFLKGLLGIPAFLLPVLLLAAGVGLAFSKNRSNTRIRIWFGAVSVLALSVFLHIFPSTPKGTRAYFSAFVSTRCTKQAANSPPGGVLGGLICTPLIMLLDKVGAGIVVGFILAASLVFCLGSFFVRLKRALFPFTAEELGDTITETLPEREPVARPKKEAARTVRACARARAGTRPDPGHPVPDAARCPNLSPGPIRTPHPCPRCRRSRSLRILFTPSTAPCRTSCVPRRRRCRPRPSPLTRWMQRR